MKSLKILFPVFILMLTALSSKAQSYQPPAFADADRLKKIEATFPLIDQLYKDYAEKNHFPALVYGIVLDGKLVHTGNMGYTELTNKTPATTASAFRIASMTKSFTAMAILKLRDEGKLKLDDPAYLYIPEMKNLHYLTADAPPITIRNLLTHGAGYPEDNPWGDRQLADTDDELIALYKKGISFSGNPGAGYEYSNLGFATLGYIIKKVSGQTYEQYITKNILIPLGMTHTYWEYDRVPKPLLAHGYRWLNNEWVEQPLLHDGSYGAMGGMITTMEDFAKYVALHLDAWPARDGKETGPIKRSSIREMHYPWNFYHLYPKAVNTNGKLLPSVSAYAYGLSWSKDAGDKTMIRHAGGLPGFGSEWRILPDYGIGVISFANVTYANAGYGNARVLDTILALSGIQPRVLPPSAMLNQRKADIIKLLPNFVNAESSGIFAQNFFMDYFTATLQKEATEAYAKAGKILKTGPMIPENNLRGYFIMEGEQANIKLSFTLTPETPAMIQEYHIGVVAK